MCDPSTKPTSHGIPEGQKPVLWTGSSVPSPGHPGPGPAKRCLLLLFGHRCEVGMVIDQSAVETVQGSDEIIGPKPRIARMVTGLVAPTARARTTG